MSDTSSSSSNSATRSIISLEGNLSYEKISDYDPSPKISPNYNFESMVTLINLSLKRQLSNKDQELEGPVNLKVCKCNIN